MEDSQRDNTYDPVDFDCVCLDDSVKFDKDLFTMPDENYDEIDHILIPEGLIKSRVEKMAQTIYYKYKGERTKPLQIFVIMNGGFQFYSALQEYIKKIREYKRERLEFETHFVKVKGYVNDESKLESIDESVLSETMVKGHDILVVEDVYDSGNCMDILMKHINKYQPNSVKCALLIHKCNPKNLKYNYKADYVGFTVPGYKFLVGYGMDYNEHFRDLSHV